MSPIKKVGVIGGDRRQYYIAKQLRDQGIDVMLYAVEDAVGLSEQGRNPHVKTAGNMQEFMEYAEIIIGPVPFCRDGNCIYAANSTGTMDMSICAGSLDEFCGYIDQKHIISGGNLPAQVRKAAAEQQAECFDFMKADQIATENAVATAEGTIAEAICESDGNLNCSRCIIFGYGRCAKALAERLNGMKAYVTIAARNEMQLQEARNKGYETIRLSQLFDGNSQVTQPLKEADYVFNTIPAPVITHDVLVLLNPNTLIIDIASKPGGTDFAECRRLGIPAKLSLGIPGRYAAKASAEILLRAMRHLLFPPFE